MPDPIAELPLELDQAHAADLADAEAALAGLRRLATYSTAGLEVLARRLLRTESVASSRIEAIDVPHRRLAEAELGSTGQRYEVARQVVGNVAAMARAVELGATGRPFGTDDLLSMHGLLLAGSPYHDDRQRAGTLRREPVFIGGSSPATAQFVPPPPELVQYLLDDLAVFVNDRGDLTPVAVAAVAHAQFETIHPFPDGNGRVGRCLVHTVLRRTGDVGTISPPVSLIFSQDGAAYVEGLTGFRRGDVSSWVSAFAVAVRRACEATELLAQQVERLQQTWVQAVDAGRVAAGRRRMREGSTVRRLIDALVARPVLTTATVVNALEVTWRAARDAITELEATGIARGPPSPCPLVSTSRSSPSASATPAPRSPGTSTSTSRPPCRPTPPRPSPASSSARSARPADRAHRTLASEMSTADYEPGHPATESLELPVEELLRRARPLPPHSEMVIDDLTPEEGEAFLEAIRS
ncbi:hypothetical protein BH20ACT9_BH20ACT9_00920 [soil metagenome]